MRNLVVPAVFDSPHPNKELLQRQLAPEGSLLLGDGRGHLFKWNPRTGAAGGLPAAVVHRRREEMGRCVRPLSSVPAAFFPQHSQGLALAPQSPGQPSGVGAALLPMGSLAAKFLLPTVSSLAFLPTVSIAAKRQFHMEAMVYFFTMFFVSVCHACEGPGLTFLCFMKYDLLQYFSIFGTALSMWVSLIALAEFDEPKRSTLVMFGVLTIAVRIYHDRWGYGVYSGPIGTAVLVITVKWLQKMKEKKGLYPDKNIYTQQVGPGFCFGALALMLRFFFEDWDYTYVHSFYHCALAMSFVLLLPKVNKKAGNGGAPAKLDCSTLCCCV